MRSKTSVYTGCFTNDYQAFIPKDPQDLPRYSATGCSPSMLANRLSWFFDLTGNSVNLDSACSSSLTAFHLACQDLWSGESTMVSHLSGYRQLG
jgi:acyl transferase domain-containing protein